MHQRRSGISVFFPAFNDEKTISMMVQEALAVLPTLTDDYEVVVINDGSADATESVVEQLALKSRHVQLISHKRNEGYGAALRSGFSRASKDLIFYTDGDGQYDVRELACLLPKMTAACDVVNGYKHKRADPYRRIIMGAIYNHLARFLFQLPIRDVDCDFRLIRRSALDGIELVSSSGAICVEMIYKLHAAGRVFSETPIHHYPRIYGRSQFFTLRHVARTTFDFLSLWTKLFIFKTNARRRS